MDSKNRCNQPLNMFNSIQNMVYWVGGLTHMFRCHPRLMTHRRGFWCPVTMVLFHLKCVHIRVVGHRLTSRIWVETMSTFVGVDRCITMGVWKTTLLQFVFVRFFCLKQSSNKLTYLSFYYNQLYIHRYPVFIAWELSPFH